MNREKRIRRLKAMHKSLLLSEAADYEPLTEEDFNDIPELLPTADQWGNHEVIMEDPTMQFKPEDLNQAISRSMDRRWITIPEVARRKGVTKLYYLDPARASEYEKYFGIRTEDFGYLHTPATAALNQAATAGAAARTQAKSGNDFLVRWLQTPSDYPGSTGQMKFLTLDPESERNVIVASTRLLEEAHERPDLMRRMRVGPDGTVETTTSHSRGIREVSYGQEISPEIQRRLTLFERGMSKELEDYSRLNTTINSIVQTLDNRMEALLREQFGVNRTARFEGSREEMNDVLKQVMLRKLLEALTTGDGPFADTELGLPSEYVIK
jgi:hypothetical protein